MSVCAIVCITVTKFGGFVKGGCFPRIRRFVCGVAPHRSPPAAGSVVVALEKRTTAFLFILSHSPIRNTHIQTLQCRRNHPPRHPPHLGNCITDAALRTAGGTSRATFRGCITGAEMHIAGGTSARSRRTACGVQHITRRGILLSLPAAEGSAARRCVFCIFPPLCV